MEMDTILVVEDNSTICSIIKNILEKPTLRVVIAHSGEDCIRIATEIKPTIILLNVVRSGLVGYQNCEILKNTEDTKDIPIIFITSNDDSYSTLKGFEVGATDYVSKPFIPEELKARIKVHMQNIKNQRELQHLMHELREMALTDYLTKLYNRRYFTERLHEYVNLDEAPLTLLLFDVDNFKHINDYYGHNVGDIVLVGVSDIFKRSLRPTDILSRWGGEEFIVCLPNTSIDEGFEIAEKLRMEVNDFTFRHSGQKFVCTVTCGVVEYAREFSAEKNITFADEALYDGKSSGKNCCIISTQ